MGQQVLSVSDPVNEGQMLSLESQPSKMALIRAMNMRRYPEIEMVFSSEVASVAAKIIKEAKDTGAHMIVRAHTTHMHRVCVTSVGQSRCSSMAPHKQGHPDISGMPSTLQ